LAKTGLLRGSGRLLRSAKQSTHPLLEAWLRSRLLRHLYGLLAL
jgi:hypothetical protein